MMLCIDLLIMSFPESSTKNSHRISLSTELSWVQLPFSPSSSSSMSSETEILDVNCNHGMDLGCDTVYRARAAVFASLTILILLHAFEMKHHRQSIFTMNLLTNKPLFISVVGGCLAFSLRFIFPR